MGVRYDPATQMWHRPGDRLILEEVPDVYGNVPIEKGDVILDLGAHIGTTSRLFLQKGARHSVAVEADPVNVSILRRNLHGFSATILPAAVGATAGRMPFYTRPDRGFVGSIIDDAGRKRTVVPVVAFADLLEKWHPTVVKADIEFSEYGLPELRALPDYVRIVAMEVHIRYIGIFTGRQMDAADLRARRAAASDLIAAIDAQGFVQTWRKDKQARPEQGIAAEPDGSPLGEMTKCACITWVRA